MTGLEVPAAALARLLADVVRFGDNGLETGAMLLSSRRDRHADVLALCGEHGIERRADQFVISGAALAQLFDWTDEAGARVVAQVHSHGGLARMSPTDRRFGLTVEGFTSAIVPHFGRPPNDPAAWGWWRFQDQVWVPSDPGSAVAAPSRTVIFDEEGVRAG